MALLEKYLVVKKSTLPSSGKGLFTKIFIEKGTLIVEYKGKVSTWKDVTHEEGTNGYIYYISKHKVINARDNKALARYANDAKGPSGLQNVKNNAVYDVINNRVYIKAMKNIEAGGEIFVGYGKSYWDTLKENGVI